MGLCQAFYKDFFPMSGNQIQSSIAQVWVLLEWAFIYHGNPQSFIIIAKIDKNCENLLQSKYWQTLWISWLKILI